MEMTRLQTVYEKMDKAVQRFDGDARSVALVAVSKTFDADDIRPILDEGQRVFGENRVQEAMGKWPDLRAEYEGVKLHLIGPLQTNKVKDAVAIFDVIESVDREKVAVALSKEFLRTGKSLPVFVQVNIGDESQKVGIAPADAVAFVKKCQAEFDLNVIGLMCIPPAGEAPAAFFAQMVELGKACNLENLSMGMSADFGIAIEQGATHVRVGSALFGTR